MQQEKQQLQNLINKYAEGKCSPAEEQQLLKWMNQYNIEKDVLIPDTRGILLKQQIDRANGQLPEAKVIRWFNSARYAAACILVIAALGAWYFIPANFNSTKKSIINTASIHFYKASNRGVEPRTINLKDGSIVQLQSGSELVWQVPFAPGSRKVELKGKAFFSITKDKHNPFTVYAGNISTTALGTSFWVDNTRNGNQVQVKLITGKVVVKEHIRTNENTLAFLNPGQELTYHVATNRAVVSTSERSKKKDLEDESIYVAHSSQLVFSNTPLNEVINRLQNFYHVKIRYNPEEIRHMTFYGEFSNKDRIESILNTIVIANELTLKKEHHTFIISK